MQNHAWSHPRHPDNLCYSLWTVHYYGDSTLAWAHDTYTCLAIKWGDVRYYFPITVGMLSAVYCSREELTFQSVADWKCLVRFRVIMSEGARKHRHNRTHRACTHFWRTHARTCTFTQTHSDGCHMLMFVDVSVCLCSWGWWQDGDGSVFIWSLSICYNS